LSAGMLAFIGLTPRGRRRSAASNEGSPARSTRPRAPRARAGCRAPPWSPRTCA
jgi:hypothetical protein